MTGGRDPTSVMEGADSKAWGHKLQGWDLNLDFPLNSHLYAFCPTRQLHVSRGEKSVLSGHFTLLTSSRSGFKISSAHV